MSGVEEAHEQALQLGMVIVRRTLPHFPESRLAARNTHQVKVWCFSTKTQAVTTDFIQQRHGLSLPQDYLTVRGHVSANVRDC